MSDIVLVYDIEKTQATIISCFGAHSHSVIELSKLNSRPEEYLTLNKHFISPPGRNLSYPFSLILQAQCHKPNIMGDVSLTLCEILPAGIYHYQVFPRPSCVHIEERGGLVCTQIPTYLPIQTLSPYPYVSRRGAGIPGILNSTIPKKRYESRIVRIGLNVDSVQNR